MSDYTLGDVIYWAFTTRAFATGVPTALAGSPTLEIYENDSTSPIVEGASKLVLTQNLASINGFNLATITATGGNGFEAGKTYHIILKTGTVGGTSVVGEVVGRFTLNAGAAFTRLGAPAGASVSADILVIDNLVDDLESRLGTPSDLGGGATIAANLADIEAQTDDIGAAGAGLTAVASAVWDLDATAHQTQGTFGQAIGDPAADTNTIYKATVTDATGATVGADSATLLTRMGTPSDLGGGASIAANLVDIEGQTDDIGAAGAGLTAVWSVATRTLTAIDEDSTTLDLDATVRAAVGMGSANLDTQLGDLPTNAELAVALGTADDAVLVQVGLVKAQTDKMAFTVANQIDANIKSVADMTVTGSGTGIDPWGP